MQYTGDAPVDQVINGAALAGRAARALRGIVETIDDADGSDNGLDNLSKCDLIRRRRQEIAATPA